MSLTVARPTLIRIAAALVVALALLALTMGRDTGEDAVAATASPITGRCTGQQQGVIKGDVTTKGREGTYGITSLKHGLEVPVDGSSGQATGRRQHEPLTFTTNVSQATPRLIEAMVRNENLTSCTFNFWRVGKTGNEQNYFRIALDDAQVVDYQLSGRPGGQDTVTFSLVYSSIEWTYVDGGVTAEDDWEAQITRSN